MYLNFEFAHLQTILHEMGHAVGLLHEVDREDSTDHVLKFEGCLRRHDGVPVGSFDCDSIMQYGFIKFKDPRKVSCSTGGA